MTEASSRLRKALARGQKVTAETFAAMSAEELTAGLTGLSAENKAIAAAHLAAEADPAASEAEDGEETDTTMGDKKKSKDKEKDYMDDKAIAEAKAEERARFTTVMASTEYAGRENLAATLLANDALSADAIITALAAAPAAPAKADDGDDDAAARAEMQARLAAEQPGSTGQAADEQAELQADDSLVANMKARYGLK